MYPFFLHERGVPATRRFQFFTFFDEICFASVQILRILFQGYPPAYKHVFKFSINKGINLEGSGVPFERITALKRVVPRASFWISMHIDFYITKNYWAGQRFHQKFRLINIFNNMFTCGMTCVVILQFFFYVNKFLENVYQNSE